MSGQIRCGDITDQGINFAGWFFFLFRETFFDLLGFGIRDNLLDGFCIGILLR